MLKDYDEMIKEMIKLGFTVDDIAKKLGYAKASLYPYLRKRNYMSILKAQRIDELREYAKTHTLKECSEKFMCSYFTIGKMCKQNNIKTVRKFKAAGINAERDTMIAYLAKKFTYESIGKMFGVTRERVRQIYEKEKLN